MQGPDSAIKNFSLPELALATDSKGWLGTGMDDIFEHRILITALERPRAGTYKFLLGNIMREDPLEYVMNVGIRVEKGK
jgi:gliding motility-associated lipoprotein GldH